MAGESPNRPFENLIAEAREGRMSVRMEPGEFVNIDRDCERFKLLIDSMRENAKAIAETEPKNWGIGAENPLLTSAATMVSWFRDKAKGANPGNDVYSILNEHYKIVEDIQTVHRLIMDRYIESDAEFASKVRSLQESLGPIAPIDVPPAAATPVNNPGSRHVSRGGTF
ncbi:hypothetical protein [Nocardia sp. AG03]|uniref:hypothetical protein n=1 Tax=Nocardia sp. AG03 TaxID=3025312 RepID=UPI0024181822|nr:hypothetical protein [Nocardia sp. AG03]